MSAFNHQHRAETTPEPTDVRFGMRGLMWTMTAVAVVAATLGMALRRMSPDVRQAAAITWGLCALVATVALVVQGRQRIRLEQMAGRKIMAIAPRNTFGFAARPWSTVFVGFLWVGGGVYFMALAGFGAKANQTAAWRIAYENLIACCPAGLFIAMGISTMWWRRTVQLREHGVLRGLRLLRWTHITNHRWTSIINPRLESSAILFDGVDQNFRDVQLAAVPREEERAAVERLLAQKLKLARREWLENVRGPDTSLFRQSLVPIRDSNQMTGRGVLRVFAVYAVIVVLVAFRPWGRPTAIFKLGFFIGIGLAAVATSYRWRRVGEAGAPLVRLSSRIDWPSALAAAAFAIGCYYVNQQLLFWSDYLSVLFGIGSGVGVSALAGIVMRERIDLCDNGIMLVQWTFLPWSSVRVVKWARDGSGTLVLMSRWRRMRSVVPLEHRDAVDGVLREKLRFGEAHPVT